MSISEFIPSGKVVVRETIVVLASILIAAWVISRFPKVKAFVKANSVTVNDQTGNTIF
jgi:hypothetical protein